MTNYLQEALGALFSNRLRTVLALLGLVIGVAAVVAIQVLGQATSGALSGSLRFMSQDTFIVLPDTQKGFDPKSMFTLADLAAINRMPNVVEAIPYTQLPVTARFGAQTAKLNVAPVGDDPRFLAQPLETGRPVTQGDVAARTPVCVISANAAEKLQADAAAIVGHALRAGDNHCTVVGVMRKAPTGAINFDFSPDILVPYTVFAREHMRGNKIFEAQVLVDDTSSMTQTERTVNDYLAGASNGKFKYRALDSHFFASILDKLFAIVSLVVGAIGAISLVVAGIGIMNILLVSIVERTREIGVRKAIGARKGQILLQFFLEAAALAVFGCSFGAVFGLLAGWYVNSHYLIKISGVIVPLQWEQSVILASVFAAVITLAFGTYPALRAARLDPIEALRYE
ncbi:MAG: ABC transporter permease [Patescibacteria group bacterium]|nr:ABC transporter permease [Patescibacteria group bacterium]